MPSRYVRIRSLPAPITPIEIAVAASLGSLEEAAVVLARELGPGDQQASWSVALEMEEASSALRAKWRHLDRGSPFQAAAEIAAELLRSTVAAFGDGAAPTGLARELAEWTRICGAREVGRSLRSARKRLGGISLREVARRSGLAPGHLSELEGGEGNLPTASTARRLDDALGTDVAGLLAGLRESLRQIPSGRQRRTRSVRFPEAAPVGSVDPRLDALFANIAGDERLIRLNQDLFELPAGARRGIAQMVRALVSDRLAGG